MAGARYHILPEDGRPSTDSMADDNDRLLGAFGVSSRSQPKKPFAITFHPAFLLRVVVLALFIVAFILFIDSKCGNAIPAIIFLGIAIVRNSLILLQHFGELIKIRINFEIIGREVSVGSPRKETKNSSSILGRRSAQLAIDYTLIITLLITSLTIRQLIAGSLICWIALPLYAISAIDMGKPSRIRFTTTFHLNMGKEKQKDDCENRIAPQPEIYRDDELEASVIAVDEEEAGGPVQDRKTRDESP